jgi:aminopeptidase-like protein
VLTAGDRTTVEALRATLDTEAAGAEIYERIRRLYPICRSVTGEGVRETLGSLAGEIDLRTREVPTGTPVFDWNVPREWNIRDAYIKNSRSERVVDFAASNLHVVSYSTPVRRRMSLADLRPHLFSIPARPDWIPYKTSYYHEAWGFCLTDRQLRSMPDEEYDVCIDSSLADGHLTLGECIVGGRESEEVLFSAHVCHPSLCNDNLSAVSVAVTLARLLSSADLRLTYRFLFNPGTIGAIAWLALNEHRASRIRHGLVLACLGDRGIVHYKRSRRERAEIDRVMAYVLEQSGDTFDIRDFTPEGYDERQYCSPGFDLPVGVLSRTPHGRFPEYHTSADNLDLMSPSALADSLVKCLAVVDILETNLVYVNRNPKCEPQLGSRGLYAAMGGHGDADLLQSASLWVLSLSDGTRSLLDIALRSRIPFDSIRRAATLLERHDLVARVTAEP